MQHRKRLLTCITFINLPFFCDYCNILWHKRFSQEFLISFKMGWVSKFNVLLVLFSCFWSGAFLNRHFCCVMSQIMHNLTFMQKEIVKIETDNVLLRHSIDKLSHWKLGKFKYMKTRCFPNFSSSLFSTFQTFNKLLSL